MSLRPDTARLLTGAAIDDPAAIRRAGADVLSLALIDARNELLRWLAAFEAGGMLDARHGRPSPLRRAGGCGWYQEYWISRHVQRQRGEHCDAGGLRLASIEPRADAWFGTGAAQSPGPDPDAVRSYLADTLETTLELLSTTGPGDDALQLRVGLRQTRLPVDAVGRQASMNLYPIPACVPMPRRVGAVAVEPSGALFPMLKMAEAA